VLLSLALMTRIRETGGAAPRMSHHMRPLQRQQAAHTAERFGFVEWREVREPRFNLAPTQEIMMIERAPGDRTPEIATSGFSTHWLRGQGKAATPINARGISTPGNCWLLPEILATLPRWRSSTARSGRRHACPSRECCPQAH
jgi:hypothetical protein